MQRRGTLRPIISTGIYQSTEPDPEMTYMIELGHKNSYYNCILYVQKIRRRGILNVGIQETLKRM